MMIELFGIRVRQIRKNNFNIHNHIRTENWFKISVSFFWQIVTDSNYFLYQKFIITKYKITSNNNVWEMRRKLEENKWNIK